MNSFRNVSKMLRLKISENITTNMKNGSRKELKESFMFDFRLIENFLINRKSI